MFHTRYSWHYRNQSVKMITLFFAFLWRHEGRRCSLSSSWELAGLFRMATTTRDWVLHHRWETWLPLQLSVTFKDPIRKQKICTFTTQFIQRFINSSWVDRYEEIPPPHMVTIIWSLIVSLYGLGAFCGSLSINFVSRMLGRCVKLKKKKTWKKTPRTFGFCGPNRLLLLFFQENGCSLQWLHLCGCRGDHAGKQSGQIIRNDHSGADPVRLLGWWDFVACEMMSQGSFCARLIAATSSGAGLGQGIHQMYLAEISPTNIRGTVCQSAATFLSLGKLSAQFIGLRLVGKVDLRAQLGDRSCSHFMERGCAFLLCPPARSSVRRICGTSSSVFLPSSLWFRFWRCLFFRTLLDICSLRK